MPAPEGETARSASVSLLSFLLARLRNVLPPGSCVKAWRRCVHQQGHYHGLGSQRRPEGVPDGLQCWRTAVAGPVRTEGQAAHACAGRSTGVGWRAARGQRAPPPLAGRCAPLLDTWSLTTGLCAADTGAVEGSPWPGRVSAASGLGATRGPLPWPAAGRCGLPSFEGHAISSLVAPASRPGLAALGVAQP